MNVHDEQTEAQYGACVIDPCYFVHNHLKINVSSADPTQSSVAPFHLWPCQTEVLDAMNAGSDTVVLKARQMGISWLACALALWKIMFFNGVTVLLFSENEDKSKELLARIKFMYDTMTPWLKRLVGPFTRSNSTDIYLGNGSRVLCEPSNPGGGRSFTPDLVIMDEVCLMEYAAEIWAGVHGALAPRGYVIAISTALGVGNYFHTLYTAAKKNPGMRTVFLPWNARPDRDEEWYRRRLETFTDPEVMKQEFPATDTEAFLFSGNSRFGIQVVERQLAYVEDPKTEHDITTGAPVGVRRMLLEILDEDDADIFRYPAPERNYLIAIDVAKGLEHGDFSVMVVLDIETWEECACVETKDEPGHFAPRVARMRRAYNDAFVTVERNDIGYSMIMALTAIDVPVEYWTDGQPGWLSDSKSKPLAVSILAEALREGTVRVHSAETIEQMRLYSRLANGRTGGPKGTHDDRVSAWYIAMVWLVTIGEMAAALMRQNIEYLVREKRY